MISFQINYVVCLDFRVLPLKKAAEEKAQALRAVAASSFKSLLREKGDITINSRWSRVSATAHIFLSMHEELFDDLHPDKFQIHS